MKNSKILVLLSKNYAFPDAYTRSPFSHFSQPAPSAYAPGLSKAGEALVYFRPAKHDFTVHIFEFWLPEENVACADVYADEPGLWLISTCSSAVLDARPATFSPSLCPPYSASMRGVYRVHSSLGVPGVDIVGGGGLVPPPAPPPPSLPDDDYDYDYNLPV